MANAEITALYWHAHQLNPTDFVIGQAPAPQNLQFQYPELNDLGVTLNRPIYLDADKVQFTSPGQASTLAGPPNREPQRNRMPF